MLNGNDTINQSDSESGTQRTASAKQPKASGKNCVPAIIRVLYFALTKVVKCSPFALFFLALATILSGLIPTLTVYVGKLVLDAIINVVQTEASSTEIAILVRALALQMIILFSSVLLTYTVSYLNYFIGKRLSLNMNAEVLQKASGLDCTFFENPHFYNMVTRAQRESSGKPLVIVLEATSIIRGSITFISMGGLIACFSLPLFIVMSAVCMPLLFIELKYGRKNYSLQYTRTEDMRTAQYISGIMLTKQNIPEILSFGLWQHLFKKWYTASQEFFRQDVHLRRQQSIAQTLTALFMTCNTVAVIGYIIYINATKSLSLTAGDIMMYSGAFAGGLSGLKTAFKGVSSIYENALFLQNLVDFNKLEPIIEVRQKGKSAPSIVTSIELQNVSFIYPGSMRFILKNVNLTFNRSESTLIVGPNGAGKTTLIKLLTRLYEPTQGRILLNGIDIREFEIESLRKIIGIIFQEFIRYAFSAKENIGCGRIADLQDTERVIAAAERANAKSFIEQLPQRYDTILSKLFKKGQELSLGQWQRICLARLFMKNAPVFILDEPTASQDIETEAHILREIEQLSKDRICILVSHRMFRKGIADKIVVLGKGKIVEMGTYDNLIAQKGEFTRLWKLYHNIPEEKFVQELTVP